jgi:hypothetical protein
VPSSAKIRRQQGPQHLFVTDRRHNLCTAKL